MDGKPSRGLSNAQAKRPTNDRTTGLPAWRTQYRDCQCMRLSVRRRTDRGYAKRTQTQGLI